MNIQKTKNATNVDTSANKSRSVITPDIKQPYFFLKHPLQAMTLDFSTYYHHINDTQRKIRRSRWQVVGRKMVRSKSRLMQR